MDVRLRGFTLIELSIVLVIIGLIAGGILVGGALIRTAEIHRIIREIEDYKAAVNTFQTKYNGLPGDLINAEGIWGSDANCPDTPANLDPKQLTCNGNGNGRVGYGGFEGDPFGVAYYGETYRFWQHLSNAGLTTGIYTGTERIQDALDSVLPGINIPNTTAFNASYHMLFLYRTFLTGGGSPLSTKYVGKHYYIIHRPDTVSPYNFGYPALTSDVAFSLEKKIDDGDPGEGYVLSYNIMYPPAGDTQCVTELYTLPSQYNLAEKDISCSLAISGDF